MKYYFWILGCAMNYSDAERIAAVLDRLGYQKTENEKEADLFFVISCSVRQSAINSIYGKVKDLRELKSKNEKLKTVLSGCILEKDRKKLGKVFDIIFEVKDLEKLPGLLSISSLRGTKQSLVGDGDCRFAFPQKAPRNDVKGRISNHEKGYLSVTPHYTSIFRAYVPISTGCDNFCSYCAVPYTRGREKSRPMEEIVAEVTGLIKKGYKEITLLGQNVNSYGKDLELRGSSFEEQDSRLRSSSLSDEAQASESNDGNDNGLFIELLKKLDTIDGDHRIYFYSNHPKDMTDELIQTLAKLKHFPHYIHLPLQSGNDEILRKMNRHTTQKQYIELVKKIRAAMPDVNLTTDIIVGYPGETEEQFQDTVSVTREVEYDMAFIARYSPREGTVSAKQPDDVTPEEKRRREVILQKIVSETVLAHNQKLVGTTQTVLIDEEKNGKYYGRTGGYKVVEITNYKLQTPNKSLTTRKANDKRQLTSEAIGQFIEVKIESVSSWKLFGKTT